MSSKSKRLLPTIHLLRSIGYSRQLLSSLLFILLLPLTGCSTDQKDPVLVEHKDNLYYKYGGIVSLDGAESASSQPALGGLSSTATLPPPSSSQSFETVLSEPLTGIDGPASGSGHLPPASASTSRRDTIDNTLRAPQFLPSESYSPATSTTHDEMLELNSGSNAASHHHRTDEPLYVLTKPDSPVTKQPDSGAKNPASSKPAAAAAPSVHPGHQPDASADNLDFNGKQEQFIPNEAAVQSPLQPAATTSAPTKPTKAISDPVLLDDDTETPAAASSSGSTDRPASTTSGSSYRLAHPMNNRAYIWPINGKVIRHLEQQPEDFAEGISIAAPLNTPVRAASDGKVIYIKEDDEKFGKIFIIQHAGEYSTAYAHNSSILVKKGDRIKRGQVVSRVGASGEVKQAQLYFSIGFGNEAVDPEKGHH